MSIKKRKIGKMLMDLNFWETHASQDLEYGRFATSGWCTGKIYWSCNPCNLHKKPSYILLAYKIQCKYDKLVWISSPACSRQRSNEVKYCSINFQMQPDLHWRMLDFWILKEIKYFRCSVCCWFRVQKSIFSSVCFS